LLIMKILLYFVSFEFSTWYLLTKSKLLILDKLHELPEIKKLRNRGQENVDVEGKVTRQKMANNFKTPPSVLKRKYNPLDYNNVSFFTLLLWNAQYINVVLDNGRLFGRSSSRLCWRKSIAGEKTEKCSSNSVILIIVNNLSIKDSFK
jgi:hypothetical protein